MLHLLARTMSSAKMMATSRTTLMYELGLESDPFDYSVITLTVHIVKVVVRVIIPTCQDVKAGGHIHARHGAIQWVVIIPLHQGHLEADHKFTSSSFPLVQHAYHSVGVDTTASHETLEIPEAVKDHKDMGEALETADDEVDRGSRRVRITHSLRRTMLGLDSRWCQPKALILLIPPLRLRRIYRPLRMCFLAAESLNL